MLRLFLVALRVSVVLSASGHNHAGGGGFEWAGIFETPEDVYMWTAQKVKAADGHVEYVDPAMKIVVLPSNTATVEALHALEGEGKHAMEMNCTEVEAGGVLVPIEDACYELHFKQDWWQSLFTINAAGTEAVAFFAQHMPTEFENTAHYLKDDHGDDIEPVAELPEKEKEPEKSVPWGPAIGAALIVNFTTLIGVMFLVPVFAKLAKSYADEFESLISGFAAGALLACAFFFLLFEATHLVAVGQKEEVAVIWRWGTMILAGFLLPGLIHMLVDGATHLIKPAQPCNPEAVKEPEAVEGAVVPEAGKEAQDLSSARARVVGGVLIGDFFHNLCDGFFVGAAFKSCGGSFGWTVAVSTIAHEIAQEVSDYFILTGSVGKLHPCAALSLNFLSGISVVLGVIVVLADDVLDASIGLLLAFGGGVYLHVAATECMPKLYNPKLSPMVRAASLGSFVLGAVAIGVVLLDHEHCIPAGAEADGHHGHAH